MHRAHPRPTFSEPRAPYPLSAAGPRLPRSGPVMQEHFRHDVTGVKLEVPRYPIAFLRSGIIASYARIREQNHG